MKNYAIGNEFICFLVSRECFVISCYITQKIPILSCNVKRADIKLRLE